MKPHNKWYIISITSLLLTIPVMVLLPNSLIGIIFVLFFFISFIISFALHHWYDDKVAYDEMVKENREHMDKMEKIN